MPTDDLNRSEGVARPPISASIICLNEESLIGECLEMLSWCDEVIVVDSGSTDRTIEIVNSFSNTKVYYRKFDTYMEQKNYALDQCQHDWVLSLDADEILTDELIEEITAASFDVAGYRLRRLNFLGEHRIRFGNWNPDFHLRLFRRSQCRWGGTNPHESVQTDQAVKRLEAPLLHYSYANREEFVARNHKYAMMMVDHLREKGITSTSGKAIQHGVGNFLKAYLLRRGFMDGSDGLFIAWHGAKASYEKHSQLARRSAA